MTVKEGIKFLPHVQRGIQDSVLTDVPVVDVPFYEASDDDKKQHQYIHRGENGIQPGGLFHAVCKDP